MKLGLMPVGQALSAAVTTGARAVAKRWRRLRLTAAVSGRGEVLHILARQLRSASADMEAEVARIWTAFHQMAKKAVGAVDDAARALDSNSGDCGMSSVVESCRKTTLAMLDRLEKSEALTAGAVRKLSAIETSVVEVSRLLGELDRSAFSNKLVALNAKIEAVRLGEKGLGFDVVAQEIAVQAGRSTEITAQVGAILGSLVRDSQTALTELQKCAAADRKWVQSSRDDVQRLLGEIGRVNLELRASLEASSGFGRELAEDIDKALIALQFQDRVSQRMGHVAESLEHLHGALSAAEPELAGRGDSTETERLAGSYTMNCERQLHHGATETGSAQQSDVELF